MGIMAIDLGVVEFRRLRGLLRRSHRLTAGFFFRAAIVGKEREHCDASTSQSNSSGVSRKRSN